jgi:hypothetical protein
VRAAPRVCRSVGKNKTVLSAAAQIVVDEALYASRSNVLSVGQSNGLTALEKVRLLSRATIESRGGTQKVMTVAVAPASWATRSRFGCIRVCTRHLPSCTTRVMWLAAFRYVRGKKIFGAPGELAITGSRVKGRTCAGFERSRSSGPRDHRGIVVDKTLAL